MRFLISDIFLIFLLGCQVETIDWVVPLGGVVKSMNFDLECAVLQLDEFPIHKI